MKPLFLVFKMMISGLPLLLLSFSVHVVADAQLPSIPRYTFEVKEAAYTRLCSENKIMTVNGEFPGPTLHVQRGDIIFVDVINNSPHNVTLHWHGVMQPRNPWIDGPEYITQCPIQPGKRFSQRVEFSTEEGTLWWHAHNDWTRATVHGAIVVHPKKGSTYPFPDPEAEVPIIFGEWWKKGIFEIYNEFLHSGGDPDAADAITINGQPGDLYPCSKLEILFLLLRTETFRVDVDHGKTYLLHLINAALQDVIFFGVANHQLKVVGVDGSYTKPFTTDYVTISPGQTMDLLLLANPLPGTMPRTRYYMAANVYSSNPGPGSSSSHISATAILRYNHNPSLPDLGLLNDTESTMNFTRRLRSLSIPADDPVPKEVTTNMFLPLSININPCPKNNTCHGPFGNSLAASVDNVSFVRPNSMDILSAYYHSIIGVYEVEGIPKIPVRGQDLTDVPPFESAASAGGTKVMVLEYNATVEVVLQGTNLALGVDHPMHIHGMSFYVVGIGSGNFDEMRDSKSYNLVDPPMMNTIDVPRNGWVVIRFRASNPGVWLMHCHVERHQTWGMGTVFIIKNGKEGVVDQMMLPPPPDLPPC
ncbi:LAC14 [Linum perenne]